MSKKENGSRRAVWMDVRADIRSGKDVMDFVEWCRKCGIDLVFAGINHITGAMTYASDVAPRCVETDEWDPTAEVLKQCRAAGFETHAWVCIGCWGRTGLDAKFISKRGPRFLMDTHPDWFCIDQNGKSMLTTGTKYLFLNPANAAVRDFHLRLCEEVLDRYQFDGYHLDYIRYHFHSPAIDTKHKEAFSGEGESLVVQLKGSERVSFDGPSLEAFQRDTGLDIMGAGKDLASRVKWLYSSKDGGARREVWYTWKSEQVSKIVRSLAPAVRKRGRKLSAAVFGGYPWCSQEIAQRWPAWVDERLLDVAAPMDYGVPISKYPAHLKSQTDAMKVEPKPAVPMVSGILSADIFDGLSGKDAGLLLKRFEEAARAQGRHGVCLYCYKSFRKLGLVWPL